MKTFVFLLLASVSLASCAQNRSVPAAKVIPPKEFRQRLETEKGILLDVRTPGEYNKGHVKGARLLNIFDDSFETEIDKLDKTKTYFVYCGAGGRSSEAAEMMQKKGFLKVYDMDGGFKRWQSEGLPTEQ